MISLVDSLLGYPARHSMLLWMLWKNHRNMEVQWWFNGIFWDLPSGKRLHSELENHYFQWTDQPCLWPLSIAMSNYQRVYNVVNPPRWLPFGHGLYYPLMVI